MFVCLSGQSAALKTLLGEGDPNLLSAQNISGSTKRLFQEGHHFPNGFRFGYLSSRQTEQSWCTPSALLPYSYCCGLPLRHRAQGTLQKERMRRSEQIVKNSSSGPSGKRGHGNLKY